MIFRSALVFSLLLSLVACGRSEEPSGPELVVYSSRIEQLIKPIFDQYTAETGVNIRYVTDSAGPLLARLRAEGENTPADILVTVDVGNLWQAAQQGLLAAQTSSVLNNNVPESLRDPEGRWTGLSIRARTIVYSSERVKPEALSSYEALAEPQWAGRLCLRTAKKVYNQSLVATMISADGAENTERVLAAWVDNLAVPPFSSDNKVIEAIAAGQCDVGIVNTYYLARMKADDPSLPVDLFWANQTGEAPFNRGVHVNISGAGVTAASKQKALAMSLLEWLSEADAQHAFAELNQEFPVNRNTPPSSLLQHWGDFKADQVPVVEAGRLQAEAIRMMDRVGYRQMQLAQRARVANQRRLRPTPLWLLRVAGVALVCAVLVPVVVLASSWLSPEVEIWQHLVDTQLPRLVANTLFLMFGVGVLVSVIGVSLAWFTVMCQFPGRAAFEWLLMLPLAVPAYVMAFVVLGVFDFGGPLQTQLRELLGAGWGIDVRNRASVIIVFSLVLYPYVYMLARSAFLSQSSETLEVARVLGCTSRQAFFRVALPMARPAIAAGVGLALMETLADFGTVAVFNYDTFTTAIYKSWFGFFSLQAAAQLASLLLLFVGVTLFAERRSRGHGLFVQGAKLQHLRRFPLPPVLAGLVSAYCALILAFAFVLPMLQLLDWAVGEGVSQLTSRFFALLGHSLWLAAMAAALTVTLALLLAFCRRFSRGRWGSIFAAAQLGYALPGSVLAVGIMLSFSWLDRQWLLPLQAWLGLDPRPLLMGTVLTLLAAYWIRFLAVASGPLDSALERVKPSLPEVARTLGAGNWRLLWEVYLPMLRPGVLTALVLVFVDVMKEMPATLLLRPFGWDTLAVRIFEMTAEGQWQLAALPALTLVLAGLIPVMLSIRASRGR